MGQIFERIDEKIQGWIERQSVFFVATAPLAGNGHINLSPKGNDTLRVLDANTLAYMDTGGSGIETVAHLRENQRIVIMMCAFDGPPKIYRFHGNGRVVTPTDPDFDRLAQAFDASSLGIRNIIVVTVTRIADSCGYGVPLLEFKKNRSSAVQFAKERSVDDFRDYFEANNDQSIDGLPGLTPEEARAFKGPDG